MEALRMGVDPVRLLSEMRTSLRALVVAIRASRGPPRLAAADPDSYGRLPRTLQRQSEGLAG